jgi:hypothetical protein
MWRKSISKNAEKNRFKGLFRKHSYSFEQVCQIGYFHTKNPNLSIFLGAMK